MLPCSFGCLFLSFQKVMLEDFHELRDKVEKGGYFRSNFTFYVLIVAHILFLDLLGWWTMKTFGTGWLPYITASVFLATAQVGLCVTCSAFSKVISMLAYAKIISDLTPGLINGKLTRMVLLIFTSY